MAAFSLVTRVVLVLVLLPVLFVGASLAWNHPPLFDAPGWGARLKIYFTTRIFTFEIIFETIGTIILCINTGYITAQIAIDGITNLSPAQKVMLVESNII